MFGILKKIFAFSGKNKTKLKKAMIISFLNAIFAAMQFLALMLALQQIMGLRNFSIWPIIGVMTLSIIGQIFCSYYSTNAETEAGYCMVAEKRIHIGNRLRYIPMGYFNDNNLGNITALVTTTLGDVESSAAMCLVISIGGFLNTLALCLMMTVFDWRLGLIAITGILCYLIVTELSQKSLSKTGPARQKVQESLVEKVLEYIQGMSIVKSYGLEKDNAQAVFKKADESCQKTLALEYNAAPWSAFRQLIVRLFSVIFALASLLFYTEGTLSIEKCLLMLIASFMIYSELENAGNVSSLYQMFGASIDRANSIDDTPTMDIEGRDITPSQSDIQFKNVGFSYGNRTILNGVSFNIPEKTTTAVVGPSGGGKTTLCNLIARFWDTNNGKILIGLHDVREYKLDSLMKNISMVFQNVYLFNDTIENNIKFERLGDTHSQVVDAAKKACCHDFIMTLPNGYNTIVGESEGNLSGSEKQRISIARAILKDSPIIILDEATASVDPENEAEFQSAIDVLTHDKKIVMIAHRFKTVRKADQILVLSGDQIVQHGTHDELIKQQVIYSDFIGPRKEAVGWKLA